MRLLLERVATMDWEIVGVFESHEAIDVWLEENYSISFEEFLKECDDDDDDDDWIPTREEWYNENELQVREIPKLK